VPHFHDEVVMTEAEAWLSLVWNGKTKRKALPIYEERASFYFTDLYRLIYLVAVLLAR
jgi:hypothetical protein